MLIKELSHVPKKICYLEFNVSKQNDKNQIFGLEK